MPVDDGYLHESIARNRNIMLEEAIADLHVQVARQRATITASNEEIGRLRDALTKSENTCTAYARRIAEMGDRIGVVCLLTRKPVV